MSVGDAVDVLLLVVLLLAALAGFRRGLLRTVVGAAGFVAGAALALWFLPDRVALVVPDTLLPVRPVVLVFAVLVVGTLVQALALRILAGLAQRVGRSPLGLFDAVLGALVTLAVAAATVWFAAGVVRSVAPGEVAKGVGQSRVVGAIGRIVPDAADRVVGGVRTALDAYGFPRVFSTTGAEPIRPVDGVDQAAAATPAVTNALASVLRIDADAPACSRSQEGTGWVYAKGVVVTNAHVVAGSQSVKVRTGGAEVPARVVLFDPERDLAVLSVDRLTAAPLRIGSDLGHGDSAVVAGYPLGGPLRVDAARVREVLQARGDDIYGTGSVQREVYSLLATVQPGNSGGPLLAPDGTVSGVIFARSLDDTTTGYALTLDEARPVLERAEASSAEVDTGDCTAAA